MHSFANDFSQGATIKAEEGGCSERTRASKNARKLTINKFIRQIAANCTTTFCPPSVQIVLPSRVLINRHRQ